MALCSKHLISFSICATFQKWKILFSLKFPTLCCDMHLEQWQWHRKEKKTTEYLNIDRGTSHKHYIEFYVFIFFMGAACFSLQLIMCKQYLWSFLILIHVRMIYYGWLDGSCCCCCSWCVCHIQFTDKLLFCWFKDNVAEFVRDILWRGIG